MIGISANTNIKKLSLSRAFLLPNQKTIISKMKKFNINKIETEKIVKSVWVAKTTFFKPNKIDVEMKGESEINAYEKLVDFLELEQKPTEVKTLPNGNKIYHFKKQ